MSTKVYLDLVRTSRRVGEGVLLPLQFPRISPPVRTFFASHLYLKMKFQETIPICMTGGALHAFFHYFILFFNPALGSFYSQPIQGPLMQFENHCVGGEPGQLHHIYRMKNWGPMRGKGKATDRVPKSAGGASIRAPGL